jgi:hypothetical protein
VGKQRCRHGPPKTQAKLRLFLLLLLSLLLSTVCPLRPPPLPRLAVCRLRPPQLLCPPQLLLAVRCQLPLLLPSAAAEVECAGSQAAQQLLLHQQAAQMQPQGPCPAASHLQQPRPAPLLLLCRLLLLLLMPVCCLLLLLRLALSVLSVPLLQGHTALATQTLPLLLLALLALVALLRLLLLLAGGLMLSMCLRQHLQRHICKHAAARLLLLMLWPLAVLMRQHHRLTGQRLASRCQPPRPLLLLLLQPQ